MFSLVAAESRLGDGRLQDCGTIAILLTSEVFVKHDMEHPMLAVFNPPVFASRVVQVVRTRRQVTDLPGSGIQQLHVSH